MTHTAGHRTIVMVRLIRGEQAALPQTIHRVLPHEHGPGFRVQRQRDRQPFGQPVHREHARSPSITPQHAQGRHRRRHGGAARQRSSPSSATACPSGAPIPMGGIRPRASSTSAGTARSAAPAPPTTTATASIPSAGWWSSIRSVPIAIPSSTPRWAASTTKALGPHRPRPANSSSSIRVTMPATNTSSSSCRRQVGSAGRQWRCRRRRQAPRQGHAVWGQAQQRRQRRMAGADARQERH